MPIPPVVGQPGLTKTRGSSLTSDEEATGQLKSEGLRLGQENYGGAPGLLYLSARELEALSAALQDYNLRAALLPCQMSIQPIAAADRDWLEKDLSETEKDARHGASTGRVVRSRLQPEQLAKQVEPPAAAASLARTTASSKAKARTPKRQAQVPQRSSERVAKRRNSATNTMDVGKASALTGFDGKKRQSGSRQDRRGTGAERQQQPLQQPLQQQQQQQPATMRHQKRQQLQQKATASEGISMDEKMLLQDKIDRLDSNQLDRVLDFLQKDLEDNCEEEELQLDLDSLTQDRRRALVRLVDQELRGAEQKALQTVIGGSAEGLASPDFPVMAMDDSPSLAPTPAAFSARGAQQQSRLHETREAASHGSNVSSSPQPFVAAELQPQYTAHTSQTGAVSLPSFGHSEDSMLDSSAEVINAVDAGWM